MRHFWWILRLHNLNFETPLFQFQLLHVNLRGPNSSSSHGLNDTYPLVIEHSWLENEPKLKMYSLLKHGGFSSQLSLITGVYITHKFHSYKNRLDHSFQKHFWGASPNKNKNILHRTQIGVWHGKSLLFVDVRSSNFRGITLFVKRIKKGKMHIFTLETSYQN